MPVSLAANNPEDCTIWENPSSSSPEYLGSCPDAITGCNDAFFAAIDTCGMGGFVTNFVCDNYEEDPVPFWFDCQAWVD